MTKMSDEEALAQKRSSVRAQINRYERTRAAFAGVKFSGGFAHQPRCAKAEALDGQVLSEPPMLPLEGCDHPNCYCHWRAVTHKEMQRQTEGGG